MKDFLKKISDNWLLISGIGSLNCIVLILFEDRENILALNFILAAGSFLLGTLFKRYLK